MKRIVIYTLTFVSIWAVWFFICPCYLKMFEGFDFFTTLPDFKELNLEIPRPVFMYISSFLLQFYASPVIGAAIHSLLTVLLVLCLDAILRMLVKNADRLVWLPFISVPAYTFLLCREFALTWPLICLAATFACAVIVRIVTWKRAATDTSLDKSGHFIVGVFLVLISVSVAGYVVYHKACRSGIERISYMDHLIENQQWDTILDEVSLRDAQRNEYLHKCVLLSLVQTGRLADEAFRYGLSSSSDFIYHKPETAMSRNFNMWFYNHLDMCSPAVYYAYQQATLFLLGMSFDAARSLVDTYLKIGDYPLAKKYIEILSHSTCHGRWVKERLAMLESIKDATPGYESNPTKYIWGRMLHDMTLMQERRPDDNRYLDILLCGLLADRQGERFYEVFSEHYVDGERVPKAYQEALVVVLIQRPEELEKYPIDKEIIENFHNMNSLMRSGRESLAKRKYAGSYWTHLISGR